MKDQDELQQLLLLQEQDMDQSWVGLLDCLTKMAEIGQLHDIERRVMACDTTSLREDSDIEVRFIQGMAALAFREAVCRIGRRLYEDKYGVFSGENNGNKGGKGDV